LVDIQTSPYLNVIIVEGSLIFAPNETDSTYHQTFDSNFIMINNGYFESGTEEFPYTSKLTLTMRANRTSGFFSIYGNKMIGCRFCTLNMHGIKKEITWTNLESTAEVGDTSITLMASPDWNVGDHIIIAGTTWHYNYDHEERWITSISGPVITFDAPLEFKHLGVAPEFGGVEMPMRAEVGLLTRNIVF
jgi:hypothetical protein